MPMQRIIESIMRGNGEAQAQAQVKDVAGKQMDATKKLSVTMTANPDDPGNPLLHIKNATADIINQTQASDLQKAYEAPKQNVEAAVSRMNGQPAPSQQSHIHPDTPVEALATKPPDDHPIEQLAQKIDAAKGYRIARPWEIDPQQLKSEDGLRALAAADGVPDAKSVARNTWKALQSGKITEHEIAHNIANLRLKNIESESHNLDATLAPQRAAATAANVEANRVRDDARSLRTQQDAEQKAVFVKWNSIKDKTDWTNIPKDQRRQAFDDQNDTGVQPSEQVYNQIDRAADRQVKAFYEEFFNKKAETYQLGHFPTFESAKLAYGHDFASKDEEIRAKNAWQTAHAYTQRQLADDAAKQDLREARLERIHQQIIAASTEKPVPIGRADLALMPTAEVLTADPSKVKNYDAVLEQKEGLVRKDLRDHTEKRAVYDAQAKAIQAKGDDPAMWDRGDREQLAGWLAQKKIANQHIDAATAELQQIQTARAARKQGKAPVAAPAAKKPDPLGIR